MAAQLGGADVMLMRLVSGGDDDDNVRQMELVGERRLVEVDNREQLVFNNLNPFVDAYLRYKGLAKIHNDYHSCESTSPINFSFGDRETREAYLEHDLRWIRDKCREIKCPWFHCQVVTEHRLRAIR
ncbi:hypothetical protein V6N11_050175 [Hibiscus sabdariffa]|uniref:Uncharacterized protein n=1 Tax=Hibiscus sabdariffa TaxID=183260 RepID=A0ABR2T9H3_9ROSI